ncbi:LOW QUALITY PROTEIN: hypothetical protein OPAG_09123, partial [Rhodococcus opacus PD630]
PGVRGDEAAAGAAPGVGVVPGVAGGTTAPVIVPRGTEPLPAETLPPAPPPYMPMPAPPAMPTAPGTPPAAPCAGVTADFADRASAGRSDEETLAAWVLADTRSPTLSVTVEIIGLPTPSITLDAMANGDVGAAPATAPGAGGGGTGTGAARPFIVRVCSLSSVRVCVTTPMAAFRCSAADASSIA